MMRWLYALYCAFRWLIALALLAGGILVWTESTELMLWFIDQLGKSGR